MENSQSSAQYEQIGTSTDLEFDVREGLPVRESPSQDTKDQSRDTEDTFFTAQTLPGPRTASKYCQSGGDPSKIEYLFKVVVIGDVGAGKTSIIRRFANGYFSSSYRATIGVDYFQKIVNWDRQKKIHLQIWDIAGGERMGFLTKTFYRGAHGALLVFDTTRARSLADAITWKKQLDKYAVLPDDTVAPCVLLANKCDELNIATVYDQEELNKYCERHGIATWMDTSAKRNIHIVSAFNYLITHMIYKKMSSTETNQEEKDSFELKSSLKEAKVKKCKC